MSEASTPHPDLTSSDGTDGRLEDRYPVDVASGLKPDGPRPQFIDFVRSNNDHTAFAYSHLIWVECPNPGFVQFNFSSHYVKVTGSRLTGLYTSALDHSLSRVEVTTEEAGVDGPDAPPCVAEIDIARIETKRTELDLRDVPIDPEDEGD
jgi:hypothetical protein